MVTEANGTDGFAAYSQSSRRLNYKFAKATVLNHWHARQALARSQAVTREQTGSWKKAGSRSPMHAIWVSGADLGVSLPVIVKRASSRWL